MDIDLHSRTSTTTIPTRWACDLTTRVSDGHRLRTTVCPRMFINPIVSSPRRSWPFAPLDWYSHRPTQLLCLSANRGQNPTCTQCDQKCRQCCNDWPESER